MISGRKGRRPRHPELLDWLASEFTESGWDVKAMIRKMVMSETYRQSSSVSEERRLRDPGNRWLARQSRFRLDAELVRDNALAVFGTCFCDKIGGPEREALSAAGLLGFSEFPQARLDGRQGRGPVSAGALHLLAADVSASQSAGVRRFDARRVRRGTPAVEHASPGACAAERPDVCRSGSGAGRDG